MRPIFISYRDCFGIGSLAKGDKPSENEQQKFAERLHAAFERSPLNISPTGRRITLPLSIVKATLDAPLCSAPDRAEQLWWDNLACISPSRVNKLTPEDEMVLFYILVLLKDLCLLGKSNWWPSGDRTLEVLLKDKTGQGASTVNIYFSKDPLLDAAR